ncbi:PP2C family protein-serine/threonine phosphatase [Streptomyces marispadix]|uniref:Serine/threonine-protein phosphatase n=1 Tax=Streptomyces marispadix TaxID=2922868 RepID=A0ABS9SY19_9ACTN|nr:PP2C family protein-serine/threonine phosphatase [Streptomyces marispadix]MCH6161176.1 serine/threonine-protein phosphatase [Streptomyces marispadix]
MRSRTPRSSSLTARLYRTRRVDWLPRWVKALPPTLVVMALVLELVTPTRYSFASFLTAAVVLAALLTRPSATVAIGALSVALLTGMHLALEDVYPDNITGPIITLVLVTAFSTLLAMILERTTLRLVQVNAVAEATQRALLRPLPERLGPVRLAGVYRAADEAALIGGDLYCVRSTPYGVRAVIGDVRGKGIGATEGVATITSAFREAAMTAATLAETADRIEAAMAMDREDMEAGGSQAVPVAGTPSGWSQESFATAVLLEFPPEGGVVRVLNRGHPPMFRLGGPDGVRRLNPEPALPLGFGDLSPGAQPEEASYSLADGETLVAYSDGVVEARRRDGTFYPLGPRLAERYGDGHGSRMFHEDGNAAGVEPAEIVSYIHRDVTRWARAINDDLVIVVFQHMPGDAGARQAPPGG